MLAELALAALLDSAQVNTPAHPETGGQAQKNAYQCGIANVFLSHGDGRLVRAFQHAFGPCEDFARGLIAAGVPVKVMHANVAGDADVQRDKWQDGAGTMFRESKNPPFLATCPESERED